MTAEQVRGLVGGDYNKAIEVYSMITMVYDTPKDAPRKAWDRAIRLVNRRNK
jgi:hypothetical protein